MPGPVYQFGDFQLDCGRFELLRNGHSLRVERKPMELLILLASRESQLVVRAEIAQRLWSSEVFVDTEHGINTAIRKLRHLLRDDPEDPQFIQTVTGLGYRFIAPVTTVGTLSSEPVPAVAAPDPDHQPATPEAAARAPRRRRLWIVLSTSVAVFMAILVLTIGPHPLASRLLHRAQPTITSIAVLPLNNLSGDPKQEYFADGMTDELITMLAKYSTLRITSRTSVMQYKGVRRPLPEIARALKVDAILEGSVSQSSNQVHMTLQLIRADADAHIWADSYDRNKNDAAQLPDEAARQVAGYLHKASSVAASNRLVNPAARPLDPAAYDGYLQGRYLLNRRDAASAVPLFRRAVVLDPDYAQGWAGLASGLADFAMASSDPLNGPIPEAKAAAKHAIELDPENGEAWSVLSQIEFNSEWNWKAAEYDLQRAIALSPGDSMPELRYATYLSIVGRYDEAVSHMRHALEMDPLSFFNVRHMGTVLFWARRYDESLQYLHRAQEMEPSLTNLTAAWVSDDYDMKGMHDESVLAQLQSAPSSGPMHWRDRLEHAYRKGGPAAFWKASIVMRQSFPHGPCSGFDSAQMYAKIGDKEETLKALRQALKEHCFAMSTLKANPLFDAFRSDPRFRDLQRQLNLGE